MRLQFEPRPTPSLAAQVLAPVAAFALTVVFGSIFFLVLDLDPFETLHVFLVRPLSSANGVSEWLLKASPLVLIGLGLAVGFRANVWNIGAEGMFICGAIAAGWFALAFGDGDHVWLLPLMALAGIAGGMAWASVPAFLKVRFSTNEILVTLMLNYVAVLLLGYLVRGPWRDPLGFNFPQTALFGPSALFDPLVGVYRVNTSIFITLVAVGVAWVFVQRTFTSYRMTVGGAAPAAARFAGFRESHSVWLGLLAGGGCAGLAGMMEVAGPLGQLTGHISPGYGFAAIIVAFIGRLHPFGIVLGGLLLSLLYMGGESAQIMLRLPAALTRTFQGALLFFLLAADFLIYYRPRRVGRAGASRSRSGGGGASAGAGAGGGGGAGAGGAETAPGPG